MSRLVAGMLAFAGLVLVSIGLLLLAAVFSVLLQGKPLDVLSTVLGALAVVLGALVVRSAWQRWRREP